MQLYFPDSSDKNRNEESDLLSFKTMKLASSVQGFAISITKEFPSTAEFLLNKKSSQEQTQQSIGFITDDKHVYFDIKSALIHVFLSPKDLDTQDIILKSIFWLSFVENFSDFSGEHVNEYLNSLETRFNEWSQLKCVEVYLYAILVYNKEKIPLNLYGSKLTQWFQSWANSKHAQVMNASPKKISVQKSKMNTQQHGQRVVKEGVSIALNHHENKIKPIKGQRNILITSALPYVNNVPHLGNIIGCVLSADVFARYCRLRGYNTLYICGTDEYGTATETKALEEKMSCQALCDKYHKVHKACYEWFGIDFDYFGRTTTPAQTSIAQDIFKKCEKSNYLKEDIITQLYCEKHQSFLADRFVEGTCPHCKYPDARGDQCDGCGKLLNAIELINPRCKLDNAVPTIKDSKHIFLDLSKLQNACSDWVNKSSVEGKWTSNGVQITNSWLKEGLKPRCITRDLKWGTPVPKEGYENKVFYVWFDAPIGYLSITANYTKDWEEWWKNPDDVSLYQFMGKDNVPFHTVIFPCSLMATGEKWTLLNHVNTTEYLQYENAKFSKSRGIGVFGNNVMDTKVPVEVWRYYLFSVRPETNDSQFTWKGLIAANNNELLANLGNFVNRVIKFVAAKYDNINPVTNDGSNPEDHKLFQDVSVLISQYVEAMELSKIRFGLKLVMDISARGNLYLQESKLDNALFANSKSRCDQVVATALNLIYLISSLVYPFMPTTSDSILRQLNAPRRTMKEIEVSHALTSWKGDDLKKGHVIGKSEYLFKRIDEKMEEEWRSKYGGQQQSTESEQSSSKKNNKKKNSSKKSAQGLSQVPEGVTKTPEMIELENKIKEQGDQVRELKTTKADPKLISDAVAALLKYKEDLASLVTADFA